MVDCFVAGVVIPHTSAARSTADVCVGNMNVAVLSGRMSAHGLFGLEDRLAIGAGPTGRCAIVNDVDTYGFEGFGLVEVKGVEVCVGCLLLFYCCGGLPDSVFEVCLGLVR